MRILTLNLRHGGGNRADQIAGFLEEQMADVLVLTEFRRNSAGREITGFVEHAGLQWSSPSVSSPKQNTVLIAAKKITPRALPSLPNEWSIHSVEVHGLDIFGLYLPQKALKAPIYDWLLQTASTLRRSVMIGDFNTGLNSIDVQGKSKFWCESDFRLLSTQLMIDAYRTTNGGAEEYSWYSRAGNGFRVDHTLITRDLEDSVVSAKYLHETRNWISDHSAMILEIESGQH